MELFQGDTILFPELTNQGHTSRDRHKVFNTVENPHHAASPKWPRKKRSNQRTQNNIKSSCMINIIKGDNHKPMTIIPES